MAILGRSADAIDMMVTVLVAHRERGEITALMSWTKCRDINGTSRDFKSLRAKFHTLCKEINNNFLNLDLILSDTDLGILKFECEQDERKIFIKKQMLIEAEYRPTNINYNKKALINKTQRKLPDDISIGLSFGWKFLFPFSTSNNNLHEVLAQIDQCIEESIPVLSQHTVFMESAQLIGNRKEYIEDVNIQWLKFVSERTREFFINNNDLFATRSDKGGHTVVIYTRDYDLAITKMLSDSDTYATLGGSPLTDLVAKEAKLMNILRKNFKSQALVTTAYEPKVKQLARFYGLPKVHKDGFQLRPIVSMINSPGKALGPIFNKMLNCIFPRSAVHIKDSYEMKDFIDTAIIRESDMLVSYDVVSMYTNISRNLVRDLIMSKATKFLELFGLGRVILIDIMNFLLIDSVVFTVSERIYMQKQGLPMGGSISTTLARIVMDGVVNHVHQVVPGISFIKIFVDDTLAAVERGKQLEVLAALNDFHPKMNFTIEEEDDKGSINFLNLTVQRDENFMITNWYRKTFASGRLLNFYSSHKRSTIEATARGFISTVLQLSDAKFFHTNKGIVEKTLRDNSFPDDFIEIFLNKFYTYMKPTIKTAEEKEMENKRKIETRFRIFPHAICKSRKIKKILHKHREPGTVFAESTRNTKINHIRTRKTQIPLANRGNIIVTSRCICGTKYKIGATKFNETGGIRAKHLVNELRKCNKKQHAFKLVTYTKGLSYRSQTKYLERYIKHKYKNKVLDDTGGFPNVHFLRLLNGQKRTKGQGGIK